MMLVGCAPIGTTRTATINTDGMSVGTVAANSLTGFDHPAGRVFTFGSQKYFTVGSTADLESLVPVFTTKGSSRDQEITFWPYFYGRIYLRCTSDRAICFSILPGSNAFSVSFQTAFTPSGTTEVYGSPFYQIQATTTLSSLIPGFSHNNDTDLFTIGCEGKTLYAKYNGVTFWEGEFWHHVVPGKIIAQTGYSSYGFRDVTCSFKAQTDEYSDYSNKIIDPRDWGFKNLTTTGSMTGGSATLTVASNPGFAIGDKIIVEIGGEAGAGEIGTKGVGGTWPRDFFANEASLPDASTYRTANAQPGNVDLHVWLEDTGKVWINYLSGGVPTWGNWTDNPAISDALQYYSRRVMPKALKATITNIVGTTFTLDTPATVSTTSANVYYDCSDAITNSLCVSDDSGLGLNRLVDDVTYRFPAGNYCISDTFATLPATNWTFEGAGRSSTVLFSPKGAMNFTITQSGRTPTFRDFKMKGWAGDKYWMSENDFVPPQTLQCLTISLTTLYGNQFLNEGGLVERVDTENVWQAPKMEVRTGGLMRDCVGVQSNGNLQSYRTWYFQTAYCVDTWYEDLTYTADIIGKAYELFGASGGGFRRCTATQGCMASNASGNNYTFEDVVISMDWNFIPPTGALAGDTNAININLNIGSGTYTPPEALAVGGTIVNPTITVVKRSSDGYMPAAISVNGQDNVRIYGTHPAKPGEGVITMSDYESGDVSQGAFAIASDEPGTIVSGIRVIGTAANPNEFSNISLRNTGTIENCVGEALSQFVGGVWLSRQGENGNITNAQYEAL